MKHETRNLKLPPFSCDASPFDRLTVLSNVDGQAHGPEYCHAGGKFLGSIACADTEKSFLAKSSMGLDVFYQAFLFDTRTVTGSPNPTVNGTYHTTNHAGGATFRVNF